MRKLFLVAASALVAAATAYAQQAKPVDPSVVDLYVAGTFKKASPEWQKRIEPDEAQRLCSAPVVSLSREAEKKLIETAKAAVVYPPDGNVIGDWKKGQQLAQRGTGGQFSDKAGGPIGGNCYACHQLSPAELSFGTLGPSLTRYGKDRKFKPEEAKATYAKIWNAQVVQPCSSMPRFGHNGFLSVEQVRDLTAYLFDPESPVNR